MTQTADVTGMTFALDADLESKFLDWIDEQNKLIVEEQLKSEEFNETQKEIQQKTLDAGAPVPIYDINSGYYSISFTPVAWAILTGFIKHGFNSSNNSWHSEGS